MCGASCSMAAKKMSTRVLGSMGSMLAARFNAFQHNVDNGVGQAGKMIVVVAFFVGEDPVGDNLVDGPEEAVRRNGDGEFLAEHMRVPAFLEHGLDEVKVLDHRVMGELADKFGAVAQF